MRHDAQVSIAAPSTEDRFVAGMSRLVGGPWGRHATRRLSWWTPVRILLVLTVLTSTLAFLQKSSCVTTAWSGDYQYTRVCYTDVFVLYTSEKLDGSAHPGNSQVGVPYRDHPVEYPAVIGALMWVGAEITHAIRPHDPQLSGTTIVDDRPHVFFDVTVLILAAFALVTTWALARLVGRERIWDAGMFALAPVLVFDGFINWDLAAVALTCLGLLAWARRRPVVAGVLLGLAVATKLYPLLVLVGLGVLCLRAARLRQWLAACAGAAAGFVVAYLPWVIATWGRTFPFPSSDCPQHYSLSPLLFFWKFSQIRGADWGSPWLAAREISGSSLDNPGCAASPAVLNLGVALATLFVVAAVALLAVAARRRPRLAQIVFLLVAGFVLVNKVDSPQYCLWLLPLAILALPRWGPILTWQITEVVLTVANFYALAHQDQPTTGLPMWPYLASMFVRDAALLWLMGLVVRDALRPARDLVRRRGVDDPIGGVLDDAPDRWALDVPALAVPAAQAR
jgi:uncharacterized membrane protein